MNRKVWIFSFLLMLGGFCLPGSPYLRKCTDGGEAAVWEVAAGA